MSTHPAISILIRTLGVVAIVFTSSVGVDAQGPSVISSTFEGGSEGWRTGTHPTGASFDALQGTTTPGWKASGGHPGGALFVVDAEDASDFYFDAPASFLGNRRNYYGGELRYDIKSEGTDAPMDAPDVVLVSLGMVLIHDRPGALGAGWNTISVTLTQNSWRIAQRDGATPSKAEFERVLTYLTALRINGEFRSGTDTGWIDNVVMTPPQTASPAGETAPISTDHGMPMPPQR